jgi:hypothetical protein
MDMDNRFIDPLALIDKLFKWRTFLVNGLSRSGFFLPVDGFRRYVQTYGETVARGTSAFRRPIARHSSHGWSGPSPNQAIVGLF